MKAVAFLENVLWNVQMWAERSCLETVEANVPVPANRIWRRSRNLAVPLGCRKSCFAGLKGSDGHGEFVNRNLLNHQKSRIL
jgi:hypothetical protein